MYGKRLNIMISKAKIEKLKQNYPLLDDVINTKEVFWLNPKYKREEENSIEISTKELKEAAERLRRFAPYLREVFPETEKHGGLIESELQNIDSFKLELHYIFHSTIKGDLYIKRDDSLPIAGSIKARGGIYEVLKYAESLALKNNIICKNDNYKVFTEEKFRSLFSQYSLAVGSTGNLGLSIGIIGSTLGFNTTVHMSSDAKAWKKELLRKRGVQVKEYNTDYSQAVKEGRRESHQDPKSYFIDDEKSRDLFLGYAVAALRLKKQFVDNNIRINEQSPLLVFLPCGVGGGPGGICFGLKKVFGKNVHCFFAEPTNSPSMLIGMMTGEHNKITVQKFGLSNKTMADGLAVGRPSKFVGKLMENLLAGIYTVKDDQLFYLLKRLYKKENIKLEPSALAGFPGPCMLLQKEIDNDFSGLYEDKDVLDNAKYLIWATGGSMVPEKEFLYYLQRKDKN